MNIIRQSSKSHKHHVKSLFYKRSYHPLKKNVSSLFSSRLKVSCTLTHFLIAPNLYNLSLFNIKFADNWNYRYRPFAKTLWEIKYWDKGSFETVFKKRLTNPNNILISKKGMGAHTTIFIHMYKNLKCFNTSLLSKII